MIQADDILVFQFFEVADLPVDVVELELVDLVDFSVSFDCKAAVGLSVDC